MTIREDVIREALRAQAQALRVPERPSLDADTVEPRRSSRSRVLIAAACFALVVACVVALSQRRAGDHAPAPPVDSGAPTTAPLPSEVPTTTAPVPSEPPAVVVSTFVGTWVTTDIFGSTSTMVIKASPDNRVEIVVTNFAQVCSGGGSTMTGTGSPQAATDLVVPSPVLTCDDGSRPESLTSLPLAKDLQNLTFSRDPVTDILADNFGSVWTRGGAGQQAEATTPPSDVQVTELLNGFLDARVAGVGAQQYLNLPADDVPLLYSTSSGAPYERAEFERVSDIAWPYGFSAFKVRLFSGNTRVEQLFFTPAAGRLGLEYQQDGFGTDIAPTTENGQPVAVPLDVFDGEVTMQVAHPWIFSGTFGRLIPEGPGVAPTTDGGERNDWDQFLVIADPAPVAIDCQSSRSPTNAAAMAESLRSDPAFGATAPLVVNLGGVEGVMIDVAVANGTTVCARDTGSDILSSVLNRLAPQRITDGVVRGRATGEVMRLYLFDAPEGSSMRVLAIAIVAPAASFERAVQAAAPVVDSVEFHAP